MKKNKAKKSNFYKKLVAVKFSAIKKNSDTMALLVSYPEFQKEVKEARDFLGIPKDAKWERNEKVREWYHSLGTKSDEIMDSKPFNVQLKMIREKVARKEIGPIMTQKQSHLLHLKLPLNYLKFTPEFLTSKFNVPENFAEHIRQYIVRGTITAPSNNFSFGPYPPWTTSREVGHLPVKIYAQLSNEELQDLKKEIEIFGDKLPKLLPLKKDINKKLTLEEWYSNRYKYDASEDKEYKISVAEIAENVIGNKKKGKQVYEAVRELKKLRRKRFGR